ncbi:MAG: DUF5654 family protein [Candidatus Nanoarchaeia archaeon]
MAKESSLNSIIQSAIISAFTIAAALIWKDIIIEIVEIFFPEKSQILFKFLIASIATAILIIVLYLILRTEKEAESVLNKFSRKRKRK